MASITNEFGVDYSKPHEFEPEVGRITPVCKCGQPRVTAIHHVLHVPITASATNNFVVSGGICFAHGPYSGGQCPQWPACPLEPKLEMYMRMAPGFEKHPGVLQMIPAGNAEVANVQLENSMVELKNRLAQMKRKDVKLGHTVVDEPCIHKAKLDEPLFTLRAQDISSPKTILFWMMENERYITDEKLIDAFEDVLAARRWEGFKKRPD